MRNNSNRWTLPHAADTSRPKKILLQNKTARKTKSLNALWKALSSYIKFSMSSTAAKPQGFSLWWNFDWSKGDVKSERERRGVETETNRQNGPWKLKRDWVQVWSSKKDTSSTPSYFRLTIYFPIFRSNSLCPCAMLHVHCRGQPDTESLSQHPLHTHLILLNASHNYKVHLQLPNVWLKTHHL